MKKLILKSTIAIALIGMFVGLLSCKEMNSNGDSTKISIDISGLLAQLPANSSSSSSSSQSVSQSSEVSGQVSSPSENDAQSAVSTLIVVPLTYSKHGEPYSLAEFSEATESDLEDDAVNSAGFLQFIQLPTSSSKVEIEVPETSEGWQLLAAATKGKLESADEFEDAVIYYIGFTEQAFKSADEFNDANVTLELQRHCDQDAANRPKGCATFDGSKNAIVTGAVEIQALYINGSLISSCITPNAWVATAANQSTIAGNIDACVAGSGISSITSLRLDVTHKESDGKSAGCQGLNSDPTSDYNTQCSGFQTYTREY